MDLSYGEEYERFRAEVREFLQKNKARAPRGPVRTSSRGRSC